MSVIAKAVILFIVTLQCLACTGKADAAVTLTYYYTNGSSYFSDAALTTPSAAPSAVYADFDDSGNGSPYQTPLSWAVLSNGIYDIGFVIDPPNSGKNAEPLSGGVISYISYQRGPNFISGHDGGRELQPSYWATPVTGDAAFVFTQGNWNTAPGVGKLNSATMAGGILEMNITPYLFRNATLTAYPSDAVLIQRVGFDSTGYVINMSWDFTYTGTTIRYGFWANAPCIYSPWTTLDRVVYYSGAAPWTNAAVTTFPFTANYATRDVPVAEGWAALTDSSGNGIGMMPVMGANMYPTTWEVYQQAQDVGFDLNAGPVAGLTKLNQVTIGSGSALNLAPLTPGSTYSLTTYVTAGSVADIRGRFYTIHAGGGGTPASGSALAMFRGGQHLRGVRGASRVVMKR